MATEQGIEADSQMYTRDQILKAANTAADDVLAAIETDEFTTDLVNLLVNVMVHYVEHPGHGLSDAIEANYDEDVETVLGWVAG